MMHSNSAFTAFTIFFTIYFSGIAFALPADDPVFTLYSRSNSLRDSPSGSFLGDPPPLSMPFQPSENAVVFQANPDFSWPFDTSAEKYEIQLVFPGGTFKQIQSNLNWLTYPSSLAPGKYFWRVRSYVQGVAQKWSDARNFELHKTAKTFAVTSSSVLYKKALSRPYPRGFVDDARLEEIKELMKTDYKSGWSQLIGNVDRRMKTPLPIDPYISSSMLAAPAERAKFLSSVNSIVFTEWRQVGEASFIWKITGDRTYLNEAKRRVLNLASWNAQGATSFVYHDVASRTIAGTLTQAFDWLHDEFTPSERTVLITSIHDRFAPIYDYLFGEFHRAERFPFDSHGVTHLERLVGSMAVLAGEHPDFEIWFKKSIPRYTAFPIPWGGEDGGYSNGTGYAIWAITDSVSVWQTLLFALDIDMRLKPVVRNFGYYLMYFLPPETPIGNFGDASEKGLDDEAALAVHKYAGFMQSSLMDWYSSQIPLRYPADVTNLLGARRIGRGGLPLDYPNSAHFSSIGWTASHSYFSRADKTSIYFKASRFGSFNHSHADQNSFVVNMRGKSMALDSGYYDWYNSPHWQNWYKQTVAHNAITYDGGVGQEINRKDANAEITDFRTTTSFDSITGDATKAYGGALKKAVRSMVYLRPDIALVYDALESAIPHQWEWNIHAWNKMTQVSARSIELSNGDARLCVDVLEGPNMVFSQTDQFIFDPDRPAGSWARQWHGRFASSGTSAKTEIVALLRMDCSSAGVVAVKREAAGLKVTLKGFSVIFAPGKAPLVQ